MGNIVISISRLCGCGGSSIASLLAKHLDLPLYDRKLLEGVLCDGVTGDENEKLLSAVASVNTEELGSDEAQAALIRKLAEDSSFIVLGRCADYILMGHPNLVRIFITADRRQCIAREADRCGISKKEAAVLVDKINRERSEYYANYSGNDAWSHPENYDLCINTADFTYEECVDIICKFLEVRDQHKKNLNKTPN